MKRILRKPAAVAATASGVVLSSPASTQDSADNDTAIGTIVVTARRVEKRLQDVKIRKGAQGMLFASTGARLPLALP